MRQRPDAGSKARWTGTWDSPSGSIRSPAKMTSSRVQAVAGRPAKSRVDISDVLGMGWCSSQRRMTGSYVAVRPLSGSMATILSPAQSAMALAAEKGERGSFDQLPPSDMSLGEGSSQDGFGGSSDGGGPFSRAAAVASGAGVASGASSAGATT